MKEFEQRITKGYCRLCEHTSDEEMVVIPFRYAGKNAPIMLCKGCVKHMYDTVFPAPKPIYDSWEPAIRFFRED